MAWSDRTYSDEGPLFSSPQKSATFWIIALTVVIQVTVWVSGGGVRGQGTNFAYDAFALEWDHLLSFQIWRWVSYVFMHGSPSHLFWNMLILFFMGRNIEPIYGRKKFIILYLAFGAVAALGHPIFEWIKGPPYRDVIGASGAVMAMVALFGAKFPRRQVIMIFVPMTGAAMAALIIGIDILQVIAYRGNTGTAHGVHLMGAAAGLVWGLYGTRMEIAWSGAKKNRDRKRAAVEAKKQKADNEEMDRILEKISNQGMGELSEKEREFLRQQSERLKSRQ